MRLATSHDNRKPSHDMKCKLCGAEDKLCNSHVVPEFFYKPMYDATRKILLVSSDPKQNDRTRQKGFYEKLLCLRCEGLLAVYEKYFSEVLTGGVEIGIKAEGKSIELSGLDYPKIKLLLLSVIWRMSVSHNSFFSDVDLGPHEEKIRIMLLGQHPGDAHEYPVMAVIPVHEGKFFGEFLAKPDVARLPPIRVYRVVMGGILFMFFIPGKDLPQHILPFSPSPNGTWVLFRESIKNIDFLREFVGEVGRGIRIRSRRTHS